jgi:hypothetical protein
MPVGPGLQKKTNNSEKYYMWKGMGMKKRVLASILVLSLAAVIAVPTAAFAETTVITATLTDPLSSVTPASGIQGDRNTSVTIVGTALTGATDVSFGAGITVNSYTIDSDTQVSANITIATNATAGTRDVSVITPGGTTTKSSGFTVVASTFSISAPANFNLGALTRGGTTTSTVHTGSVTTNAQFWQITATGGASHSGKMWNGSASPTALFQFSKDGNTWDTADGTLTYTQAGGTNLDLYGRQSIDSDDPAGTYTIIITFTGSVQ